MTLRGHRYVVSRSPQDAVRVAQRIEEALATPFSLDTQEVSIGASIPVNV